MMGLNLFMLAALGLGAQVSAHGYLASILVNGVSYPVHTHQYPIMAVANIS